MLTFFCKTEQDQNISFTGNSLCGFKTEEFLQLTDDCCQVVCILLMYYCTVCTKRLHHTDAFTLLNNFQRQCPVNKCTTVLHYYIKGGRKAKWFRVRDLKSGGPWFKSFTLLLSRFVLSISSSTPQLCCVNSPLASLPSVGILNISLCSICNICLLNTIDTYIKYFFYFLKELVVNSNG